MDIEWQCPSCTLLNRSHSFKCRACGTPKGTSTRQSKHTVAFEQQYLVASLRSKGNYSRSYGKNIPSSSSNTATTSNTVKKRPAKTSSLSSSSSRSKGKDRGLKKSWPTLDNIDRSSGQSYSITVGSVTVVITEYKLLQTQSKPVEGRHDKNSPISE